MRNLFLFILMLFMLFSLGCAPGGNNINKEYFAIDVSGSAENNLNKNMKLLTDALVEGDSDNINICIFADQCYEVYDGARPAKDRDAQAILQKALLQAQKITWKPGTSLDQVLFYLRQRINTSSDFYIYTDGFFELHSLPNKDRQLLIQNLHKNGLQAVRFFGIDLRNKNEIYSYFQGSQINLDLN